MQGDGKKRLWTLPLLLGAGLMASAVAEENAERSKEGFIEGSEVNLLLRNFYFNRDFRKGQSSPAGGGYTEEWVQGFMANFSSGFTQGTLGVGIDAFAQLGVRLDSGGGRSGAGGSVDLLPYDDQGRPQDDYSRAGGAVKLRWYGTVLRVGDVLTLAGPPEAIQKAHEILKNGPAIENWADDARKLFLVDLDGPLCEEAAGIAELTGVRTLDALHLAAARRVGDGVAYYVSAGLSLDALTPWLHQVCAEAEQRAAHQLRLDQRGVGPADGVAVQVADAVEPQRCHRVGVVDGADEVDLVGRSVHDRPVVLVLVRSVGAEHHQAHPALPSGEGADELEDRVLGDRPTDQREIGARLQAERLVLAGGAWSAPLAATAGIALPVSARRRSVYAFRTPEPAAGCPLVIDPSGLWFRPEGPGQFICGGPPLGDDALNAAKIARALGYCPVHYYRFRRHGDPEAGQPPRRKAGEGSIDPNGYRVIQIDKRRVLEHRALATRSAPADAAAPPRTQPDTATTPDTAGRRTGEVIAFRDVTQEHQIRRELQRLSLAVEHAASAIFIEFIVLSPYLCRQPGWFPAPDCACKRICVPVGLVGDTSLSAIERWRTPVRRACMAQTLGDV